LREKVINGPGKKFLLGLALCFALVLLLTWFYNMFESPEVAGGVTYRGIKVEGYSEEEIRGLVKQLAPRDAEIPRNAQVDYKNELIVPEVNGVEVDIDATVRKIMEAPAGREVEPELMEITPLVAWRDYPALPAYKGNPTKNKVSFMINVAWGEEYIPDMLEVLKEEEVKATFFITGKWAEKKPDCLKKIYDKGHEIGNHGYSDGVVMSELDWNEIEESLSRTNEVIYHLVGEKPSFFTPHKGDYHQLTLEMVCRQSMRTVLWSLDTVDWSKPGVERMERKIRENISGGDIILMHPLEETIELLPRIIPYIKEQGMEIVPVEELLAPASY